MKLVTFFLIASLLAPSFAFAQGNQDIVTAAKAALQARGVNLAGPCGAFRITQAVAWQLRPSYGFLLKRGGNRAVMHPDGTCVDGDFSSEPGYATDYLIDRNTGFGYDILGDGGGQNNPQWPSEGESDAGMVARNRSNFIEAFSPAGEPAPQPIPLPAPVPQPQPVPQPAPTVIIDYTVVLRQILDSQAALLDAQRQSLLVAQDTNKQVSELNRSFGETIGAFSKFAGKYIAPALAAFLAGRQMTK